MALRHKVDTPPTTPGGGGEPFAPSVRSLSNNRHTMGHLPSFSLARTTGRVAHTWGVKSVNSDSLFLPERTHIAPSSQTIISRALLSSPVLSLSLSVFRFLELLLRDPPHPTHLPVSLRDSQRQHSVRWDGDRLGGDWARGGDVSSKRPLDPERRVRVGGRGLGHER